MNSVATPLGPGLRFAGTVQLSKHEVFAACQALADADRRLVRAGWLAEADALGALFALLEDRLVAVPADGGPAGAGRRAQPGSGRYSMDSEFTQ